MFKFLLSCACLFLMAMTLPAQAGEPTTSQNAPQTSSPSTDLVPPQSDPILVGGQLPLQEYPLLRLTPDKTEVIHLDRDAATVIIGNSKHVVAVLETPRQILLVPRLPGATHFQAVDAKGETVMARNVIVASPKQDYVRVRRACGNKQSGTCEEYSVFYCPDMCHQIALPSKNDVKGDGIVVPDKTASTPTSDDDQPEAEEGADSTPENTESSTQPVEQTTPKPLEPTPTPPTTQGTTP